MTENNLDSKSLQFLSCLRVNSREKLTTISKNTGIPISTLFDMLKELQNGLITKNTVLIDFSRLGYHTRAQVLLRVNKDNRELLRKYLITQGNVNCAYKVNNGWDFIIETAHKSIKELDLFIETLNDKFKIEAHQIHYLIDELKKEGLLVGDILNSPYNK